MARGTDGGHRSDVRDCMGPIIGCFIDAVRSSETAIVATSALRAKKSEINRI